MGGRTLKLASDALPPTFEHVFFTLQLSDPPRGFFGKLLLFHHLYLQHPHSLLQVIFCLLGLLQGVYRRVIIVNWHQID